MSSDTSMTEERTNSGAGTSATTNGGDEATAAASSTAVVAAASSSSSTSSLSSIAPSPSFTPLQLSFFNSCVDLLSAAVGPPVDMSPLKQFFEFVIQQKSSERTHTDTVTVMQHILPDLSARLQSLHVAKVKVWLLELMEALVRLDASQFIPPVITIVTSMTAEENVAVVKKVLSIACSVFPLVYSWLSYHSGSWGGVHENMYRTVEQLRSQLIALWKGPNEGLKPSVIKIMEVIVLTLTNEKANPPTQRSAAAAAAAAHKDELRPFSLRELPADHPVLSPAKLKGDVDAVLETMLSFAPTTATTFSYLLKSLSTLCKHRSLVVSDRIVDRLNEVVDLILMEEAQLQLLPSEQQVSRVKKDLQACLLDVLKSQPFTLASFDSQQAQLVRGLAALGSDSEAAAEDLVKQQNNKRIEFMKQQGTTYLKEITQATTTPSGQRPTPLPLPSLMQLLDDFSRLSPEQLVELVTRSISHFTPPASCAATYAQPDPTPTFIQFLQECLQAPFNTQRAETSAGQRQQFLEVADKIKQHMPEAINTLYPPLAPPAQSALVPSVVRTVVPPIPIPDMSVEECESLSRSAFTRIASLRTASTVERSGASMLRNVILAKLSTTNLMHERVYTNVRNVDLDPSDPHASTWTSSLLAAGKGQNVLPLRAYISGRLQDSSSGGYESVLNVLYSLLCVDTSQAKLSVEIKESEKETQNETEEHEGEEFEEEFEEGEVEDGEIAEKTDNKTEKKDEEMKDATDATNKKRKRKETSETTPTTAADSSTTAAADGAEQAEPDSKRSKNDAEDSTAAASVASSSAAAAAASLLPPPVLPPFSQYGTVEYGEVLDLLLDELREGASSSEGRQHLYRRFLLDIPLLTPRVFASIDDWIYDPARSVIGLAALRDLILYRPPVRHTALELLLGYTHKPQAPLLRNQALRLVVNQLYIPNPHLRSPIFSHAVQLLEALSEPELSILADLPEIVVNVVVPPVPLYDQIEVPARKSIVVDPLVAAALIVKNEPGVTQNEAERRARAEAADLKTRQEISNLIADAEYKKKKFDRLVFLRELREKEKKLLEQQRDERMKRRIDRISRQMELYLALCTNDSSLLRRVFQVYASCSSEFVRRCIQEQMSRIIRVLMRLDMAGLIKVIEEESLATTNNAQHTSEALVLHTLQLITALSAPPAALVQAVTRIYQAKSSPRYLIPILSGLPLDSIRRYLPRLITLPPEDLRVAFHKLLHSRPPSSIKASELLIALHLIPVETRKRTATATEATIAKEKKEDEDALDKRIIAATKLCFDDPSSFPPEVLGVVLSQLSDHTPLPKLLMRTVMQSMMLHSSLKSFIVSNLLIKLINQHIYLNPVLWQGFLAASNMLLPQSIPILIQLPDQAFIQLMQNSKLERLQQQLVQFIQAHPLQVRRSIRELVQQQQQEKSLAQQAAALIQQQQQQSMMQ